MYEDDDNEFKGILVYFLLMLAISIMLLLWYLGTA